MLLGDFNLLKANGCLHIGEFQATQSVSELDYALKARDDILQVSTVFLKNVAVNQRKFNINKTNNLCLYMEVYRKYECSANQYFTKHHQDIDVLIAYYWYGYIHDQLALLNAGKQCIYDSHPGNVFVLNGKFYWGEYGISLNAINNSNNAVEYLLGSIDSTVEMFDTFLFKYCRNDQLFRVALSFLKYVKNEMDHYVQRDNFILTEYLEVAMTAIQMQVHLFPVARQKLFYAIVGEQVSSKVVNLFQDVADLKSQLKQDREKIAGDLRKAEEVRQRDLQQAEDRFNSLLEKLEALQKGTCAEK